jgi:hypothetical protein
VELKNIVVLVLPKAGSVNMSEAVCSRCGRVLTGQSDFRSAEVCASCWEAIQSTFQKEFSVFLESLERPAALVDRNLSVLFHNNQFLKAFAKINQELVGLRLCESLDCAYVPTDRRCEESPQCLQCGLKRVVEVARISGEKVGEIGTTYSHKSGFDQTFRLTAERTGDAVFLVIST